MSLTRRAREVKPAERRASRATPLEAWREQLGGPRRRTCPPRPLGAMGFLPHGPVIEGLIEIEKLVLVVLHDEQDDRGRQILRLAGFSGAPIPWGVRWGGHELSKFYKNLLLQPRPGARGLRLDTASADLLQLALQMDRDLQRHIHYGRRCKRQHLLLPRLWAGFRAAEAAMITGDGPELTAYCQRTGHSPDHMLRTCRRDYFGLALYPFPFVSHHWQKAVEVFADLERFPWRQIFPLENLPDDLVGCQGVAEHDFFHSRFRTPSTNQSADVVVVASSA